MPDQPIAWIVVADAAYAEIFRRRKRFSKLERVGELSEPRARARERELVSDAPGRSFDSHGHGRHAMEADQNAKQSLREGFARQIAERLSTARASGEFGQLVIVAAPAMLGELRSQNLLAMISLFVALSALGYNTWRNELTEQNRNVRQAGFEMLLHVGEL